MDKDDSVENHSTAYIIAANFFVVAATVIRLKLSDRWTVERTPVHIKYDVAIMRFCRFAQKLKFILILADLDVSPPTFAGMKCNGLAMSWLRMCNARAQIDQPSHRSTGAQRRNSACKLCNTE